VEEHEVCNENIRRKCWRRNQLITSARRQRLLNFVESSGFQRFAAHGGMPPAAKVQSSSKVKWKETSRTAHRFPEELLRVEARYKCGHRIVLEVTNVRH
jgi:lipocalin